jgi:hypothetical protein
MLAQRACPGCGVPTLLTISVSPAPASRRTWGLVRECGGCWRARAEALEQGRSRLRAMGVLGTAPDGRLTHAGAVLAGDGADELENALVSELLRRGILLATRETLPRVGLELAEEPASAPREPVEVPA